MSYTVRPSTGGLLLNQQDRVQSILQNISIILRTCQQSVPLYREFGLPMRFLDRPLTAALPTLIVEVREAIMQYEPRAEIVSINVTQDQTGVMTPEVEVEILEPQS